MKTHLIAACIQTNAAPSIDENLKRIEPMIRDARARGAELITLPENVSLMITGRERLFAQATDEIAHPAVAFFKHIAEETGAWILAGSIAIRLDAEKLANRSYLFSPAGDIAARYDKIHLFDAKLSDDECYRESEHYRAGKQAVAAATPWGKIGLTICYDVRFPHLHRSLAQAGAKIITVPAAFAKTTGEKHWHVLTRARAIETGSFVLAPAQCGTHEGGRQTYGHSLIIAPDGTILADAGDATGIIMAELDLEQVTEARRRLPCLQHDRAFAKPL